MSHSHLRDDIDFVQLHGAFDAPIAPSPRFAAQLKEELMAELTASDRIRPTSIARATRDKGQISRVQTLTTTNWQSTLMTAAAILAVLALSFASLRYVTNRTSDGGDDRDSTGITSGQLASATPESSPEVEQSADSAGSDRSNTIGAVSPNLSKEVGKLPIEKPVLLGGFASAIVGKIYVTQETSQNGELQAFDLETGKLLWEYEPAVASQVATDGTNLFAFVSDNVMVKYGIVAIDLNTGEELWHFADPTAINSQNYEQGPTISNGIVYMNDGPQTFYALNAATGEELWAVTLNDELNPYFTAEGNEGTRDLIPQFAADDLFFYTLTGSQFLSAIDPKTGAIVWTEQVTTIPESGTFLADLAVQDGKLFVVSRAIDYLRATPVSQGEGFDVITYAFTDAKVQAFTGSTGEQRWSTEVDSAVAPPVVVGDSVIVASYEDFIALGLSDGLVRSSAAHAKLSYPFAELRTSGGFAYAALGSGEDIVIYKTDGESILQQWNIPTGGETSGFEITGLYSYNQGLVLSVSFDELYYIAPELTGELEATPESSANWGANSGKTWVFDGPPIDENLTAESHGQYYGPGDSVVVSGNYIIEYGWTSFIEHEDDQYVDPIYGIKVFDLTTNAPIWSTDVVISPAFAVNGDLIIAVKPDKLREGNADTSGDTTAQLIAISVTTGKEVWTGPVIGLWSNNNKSWGPVVDHGIVYVADAYGSTFAVDATTGAEIWHFTEPGEVDVPNEMPNGGSLVLGDSSVYVAGPTYNIFEIDKRTGALIRETSLISENKSDRDIVTLQFNGTALIAIARLPQGIGTPVSPLSNSPETRIFAMNPANLDTLWSNSLNVAWANTVLTTDRLLVPVLSPEGHLAVSIFDPLTGEKLIDDIKFSGASTVSTMVVVGSTLFLQADVERLYLFDIETGQRDLELETLNSTRTQQIGMPIGTSGNRLVTMWYGQVYTLSPTPDDTAATPTAPAPESDVLASSGGYGGADRTFNVGATLPSGLSDVATGVDLANSPLESVEGTYTRSQIIEGLLVRQFTPSDGSTGLLQAFDVETQEEMWSVKMTTVGGFASDGSSLFVIGGSGNEPISLRALDLNLRSERWSYFGGVWGSDFLKASSPVYFDGLVYFTPGPQEIVAVNAASGEITWSKTFPFMLDSEPSPEPSPSDPVQKVGPPTIAVDESGAYVIWANVSVQALDRHTGMELWHREMSAFGTRGEAMAAISLTNDLVLVGVHRPDVSGEDPTSMITAFEKSEGLTRWQMVTGDFVGNFAIAGTTLVVPMDAGTVDTIDIDAGERTQSYTLGWIGADPITISATNDSFIATYWQAGIATVEIVPLNAYTQSGTWELTSTSASSWEYVPEAHIVGDSLVIPGLDDKLWIIQPG